MPPQSVQFCVTMVVLLFITFALGAFSFYLVTTDFMIGAQMVFILTLILWAAVLWAGFQE